jgi:hypothetical protein
MMCRLCGRYKLTDVKRILNEEEEKIIPKWKGFKIRILNQKYMVK